LLEQHDILREILGRAAVAHGVAAILDDHHLFVIPLHVREGLHENFCAHMHVREVVGHELGSVLNGGRG
jgi:hypothetical protein